jgi:hypothetical protein
LEESGAVLPGTCEISAPKALLNVEAPYQQGQTNRDICCFYRISFVKKGVIILANYAKMRRTHGGGIERAIYAMGGIIYQACGKTATDGVWGKEL